VEYELLGLSTGRHVMELYRPQLDERGIRSAVLTLLDLNSPLLPFTHQQHIPSTARSAYASPALNNHGAALAYHKKERLHKVGVG
jgi:hypothetical protein